MFALAGVSRVARTVPFALVALLSVMVLAGCAAGKQELDGSAWRVSSWADETSDPTEFELTASFVDGEIRGRSAVNSFSGSYSATGAGEFSIGMLAQTLMAGPEPAMNAEATYLELLQRAVFYEIDGDSLILISEDDAVVITFVRAE